ncbi:hypothetical protein FOXYSP1_00198 [Fusarium oxysporum f. sp. phaseoli]
MTVEFECGFSIYPPLPPTPSNHFHYALFLSRLRTTFSPRNHPSTSNPLLITDADSAFYYFTLPKYPKIPANPEHCNYFLSFRLSFGNDVEEAEEEVRMLCKAMIPNSMVTETVVETPEEENVVEVGALALLG